MKEKQISKK